MPAAGRTEKMRDRRHLRFDLRPGAAVNHREEVVGPAGQAARPAVAVRDEGQRAHRAAELVAPLSDSANTEEPRAFGSRNASA